jgi:hypothetical protein
MSDIPHVEIRQCHSYNEAGARCEHPAGHTGKHYISVEWTDAEAWTPLSHRGTGFSPPVPVVLGNDGYAVLLNDGVEAIDPDPPQGSGRCFCGHALHDGRCGEPDGEFECDCSNAIEI